MNSPQLRALLSIQDLDHHPYHSISSDAYVLLLTDLTISAISTGFNQQPCKCLLRKVRHSNLMSQQDHALTLCKAFQQAQDAYDEETTLIAQRHLDTLQQRLADLSSIQEKLGILEHSCSQENQQFKSLCIDLRRKAESLRQQFMDCLSSQERK